MDLVGQRIGNFTVDSLIGEGAMGVVYRGVHETLDREVAIKILQPQLAANEKLVSRFVDEARAASRLGHPNLIQILDFGTLPDGRRYSVMEYLDGRDLASAIEREGRQPIGRVAAIGAQIASALHAAHSSGIVHRDIKPANIFLARDETGAERVKVLDFGIAKLMAGDSTRRARTAAGQIVGTPEYMAPEQAGAEGGDIDGRADIYSLGCVLYTLLVGRPPHTADSLPAILLAQLEEAAVPPRQLRPDVSPEMEAIVMRCLAKPREARFQTMAEVEEALLPMAGALPPAITERARTLPPTHSGIASSRDPLVGRDGELESLSTALSDLTSGRGAVFFVVGEPGIGKSRLAAEVADRATARGFRVVWGRCWEGAGAPAFWPWIQVLRTLASEGEPLGELARLLPESGPAPELAPADRFEVFDGLGRLLRATANHRPLVVVLEDLHTADHATLAALEFVVRHATDAPLLVIGTYRDVAASPPPEATVLLERAARAAVVLHLERLSEREVAALVGKDAETATAVYRATEGNPLFVHEVLRVLSAFSKASRRVPIPGGIRAAIREHVRLAGGADEPLEVAATLGREFGLASIAAVLGSEQISVAESLAPAVRAHLLAEPGPRRYRFTHVLIRDTLYDDLSPARRVELHRQVADGLSRLHEHDPAAPLDEIAHHYFEAGPEAIESAIDAARRAAERAIRILAFEEAVAGLERALRALEATAPGDAHRRAELLIESARARILCGDIEAGLDACREVGDLARSLGSAELLARAALTFGQVYTFAVPGAELTGLLEEAIAALGAEETSSERASGPRRSRANETPLLARAMARLAGALQPAPTPDRPIALARESIAMARRLGDEDALLYVLQAGGSALFNLIDPSERADMNRELLRLASARGDVVVALRARIRLFVDSLDLGEVVAADAELTAYEEAAVKLKQPRYHWPTALMRAARAQMDGRFGDSDRYIGEARRFAEAAGDSSSLLAVEASEMVARRLRGEPGVVVPPEVIPAFPIPGAAQLFSIPCVPGQEARARAAFFAAPEASLSRWTTWTAFGILLAEVALFVDDAAIIANAYDWLAPHAARNGTWGGAGLCCEGPVARWLCRLASRLEKWEDAERHFQDALTRGQRMGMRPFIAQLESEWAEELERRGRSDEARRHRERAREIAEALEMTPLLARLEPSPGRDVRLVSEGAVWLVEGEGQSCRVKDSRGMQILAVLVANPDREFHCLELGGGASGGKKDVIDLGDAGAALDPQARDAYRARLRELRAEIEQAEEWNDQGRAAKARDEIEFLERELTRAFGLGGRDRKQASASERARINVQRRLKHAITSIGKHAPALAEHLAETVRTGNFCCFEPDRPRRR